VRQAPYMPSCGSLAETPHAARLAKLPQKEQYAALELFRGTMLRHNLIVYRDDNSRDLPHFDNDAWLGYVPVRLPEAISVQRRLPKGAAAVLINQNHTDPDLALPVSALQLRLFEAIDGKRSVAEIFDQFLQSGSGSPSQLRELARSFFERIWWHDQVVFDASRMAGGLLA